MLTQAEVDKIRLVVYLPEPHETADEPSPSTDLTRLAHAPMYLPSHKATCAICQEMFEPPREGRTILLQAEPLRLLGCGHVYHVSPASRQHGYQDLKLTSRPGVSINGCSKGMATVRSAIELCAIHRQSPADTRFALTRLGGTRLAHIVHSNLYPHVYTLHSSSNARL